jgi:hypothetical protein
MYSHCFPLKYMLEATYSMSFSYKGILHGGILFSIQSRHIFFWDVDGERLSVRRFRSEKASYKMIITYFVLAPAFYRLFSSWLHTAFKIRFKKSHKRKTVLFARSYSNYEHIYVSLQGCYLKCLQAMLQTSGRLQCTLLYFETNL